MKYLMVVELDLHVDPGFGEAADVWAWSVERQLEELALVNSAGVVSLVEEGHHVIHPK